MDARFPFLLEKFEGKPEHVARLEAKRAAERKSKAVSEEIVAIEDLLDGTEATVDVAARKTGPAGFDPAARRHDTVDGRRRSLRPRGARASQLVPQWAQLAA